MKVIPNVMSFLLKLLIGLIFMFTITITIQLAMSYWMWLTIQ